MEHLNSSYTIRLRQAVICFWSRWVRVGAAAVSLAACGATAIGPTPTPDPCSAAQIGQYLEAIDDVARRFDDALVLADTTPRGSLPPQIATLQEVRRDTENLSVPSCAEKAKLLLVHYMDSLIEGYLRFMRQDSDAWVTRAFEQAADLLIEHESYMHELRLDAAGQ